MRLRTSAIAELALLLKPFWRWVLLSAVCGTVSGVATVALLATINHILNRPGGLTGDWLAIFIGCCLLSLVGRGVSDMSTNIVGQRLVAQVRKALARKILGAPIDTLERYRTHRLIPVLTQDVDMISDVAFSFAATVVAMAVALGCLGYLAWLSPPLFGVLVVALALGSAAQMMAQARGMAGFWKARDAEETLHKSYRGISEGAKELRMHRSRRAHVLRDQIDAIVDRISAVNSRAINTYVIASAFGAALFFLLIALVLAWAAWRGADREVVSGFVLILLFLKGPMDQIMLALPQVGRAKVAFERIADLSRRFASPEGHLDLDAPPTAAPLREGIALRQVRYAYPAENGLPPFVLGPVDLEVRAGELLFIVGDNGSGKTTLIKLLLGLYAPQQGQILRDGQPVDAAGRDDYRQLFTTVFADFYLFEGLAAAQAHDAASLAALAEPYLKRLELAHKVSVQDGRFTTSDLSTGQRKRLALVHAYLEGRPVLVFDEWAADQDPAFRQVFYTELLPELRAKGHALVVISHDDRYFHVADRVVHLHEGRIVAPTTAAAPSAQGAEALA